MENEVREVTNISISLILLAIVIGFISYCIKVTHQAANIRNNEITSNEKIEQFREYNGYDCRTLIGDDAIELIRLKYDSGVTIFVDYRRNISSGSVVNETDNKCANCTSYEEDHRFFDYNMYFLHKDGADDINYFKVAENNISTNRDDLRNWFPSTSSYRAYLVYNSENPVNVYQRMIDNYDTVKGGYPNTNEGKLEALDSGQYKNTAGSEVTGVILISYNTLGIT